MATTEYESIEGFFFRTDICHFYLIIIFPKNNTYMFSG